MSTKEIGLPISLGKGTHNNTEIKDGKLQLKEIAVDSLGRSVYAPNGFWESSVISIGDKVTAFQRVVKTIVGTGSNVDYKIFTKSSTNNIDWSEYVEITYLDGRINSPVGLYARLKIELSSSSSPALLTIDNFRDGKFNTDYVTSSDGSLKLRRERELSSVVESNADGFLHRTKIDRSKIKKINTLVYS